MFINYNEIMFRIKSGQYAFIGSGSSRKVYDLDNGYVVKVAKNDAGTEQNRAEFYISQNDDSGLFAKVINVSNDYSMLIMKKAKKVRDVKDVWHYFNAYDKHEFYKCRPMQKIKKKYKLLLGDFAKASSWGMIHGKPVIIDYGFTEYVEKHYYRHK